MNATREVLDALHRRYNGMAPGNGRRFVVAEEVRSAASWYSKRSCDFVALDTWQSGGFDLIGHEVKVSRSDWLRELKQPEKAAEFIPWMNRWFLVVSDAAIVRDGELPAGWGLLALAGDQLRMVHKAKRKDVPPMSIMRQVAFARAVQRTAAPPQFCGYCRKYLAPRSAA